MQVLQNTTSLNLNDIATYAHGVKPTLDILLYYPDMNITSTVDLTSQSKFVTEMHALNLAVHPYTYLDD